MGRLSKMDKTEKLARSIHLCRMTNKYIVFVQSNKDGLTGAGVGPKDNDAYWQFSLDKNLYTVDEYGDPHFPSVAWSVLNWAMTQDCWHAGS